MTDPRDVAIELAEQLADDAEHFVQMVVNAALDEDEGHITEQIDDFIDYLKVELLKLRDSIIKSRHPALWAKLPRCRADDIAAATRAVARQQPLSDSASIIDDIRDSARRT